MLPGCVLCLLIVASGAQLARSQDFFGIPLFSSPAKEAGGASAEVETKPAEPDSETAESGNLPAELKEFLSSYREARSRGFLKVNGDYSKKLDAMVKAYRRSANLDGALAATREFQRVEAENNALNSGGDFPALAAVGNEESPLPGNILAAYRNQVEQKALGVTILNRKTAVQMEKLKITLVRAGDLTGAQAVDQAIVALKTEIEALKEPFADDQESTSGPEEKLEEFLTGTTWKVTGGRYAGSTYVFVKGRTIERYFGERDPGWVEKYKVIGEREIEYVLRGTPRRLRFDEDLKQFVQTGYHLEGVLVE